jgi:8-oxo-dGTP diphosphatase
MASAFFDGKVLVCQIRGRGWSIPGGHLEGDETPEECLRREVREEGCAEIEQAVLAGFLIADHSINTEYTGAYPTKSALAVFAVSLGVLRPYVPSKDAQARELVGLDALPSVHHQWDLVLDEAYKEARRRIVA